MPLVRGRPGAAGIEGADAADAPVGDVVSVAADDDVGVASGQQPPQLLIRGARSDARAVICPR